MMIFLSVILIGCQAPADNSGMEAFEKNSEAVLKYLDGFQNENLDYSIYAKKLRVIRGTSFNAKDSTSLAEFMANDRMGWAKYDFKLITPINLLPGVDPVTKKPDGSVRYYGTWEVTLEETDSTNAKSATIRLHESFRFDDEGKIVLQSYYGDGTGLFKHLEEGTEKEEVAHDEHAGHNHD